MKQPPNAARRVWRLRPKRAAGLTGQNPASGGPSTAESGDPDSLGQVSWLADLCRRRLPILIGQWLLVGRLPAHSGATAAELHRLPYSAPADEGVEPGPPEEHVLSCRIILGETKG